ncbi:head-tail joining protein [Halomonas caseinilytica]|uniref:Uncharacterized protein n=1 Tax=Halomonas caseinilytica TaxID=438744 RepID=A0A1M6TAC7_9GAMM|nr:hypothetical protein [Halomonas caseinilytica]SHK53786.1 hypothetical protein SAMN05192556_103265 [Halomonas caseinilytica]
MSFQDHLDRLDEAVMTHLSDGTCDYQGSASSATGIPYMLDHDFEVDDENQVPMHVTTVSVQVSDVATSRQGDQIVTPSRTWDVQQILEDDGHMRRLWVS